MRIAVVGLMVGVLASVSCGALIPVGWLSWTETPVDGFTAYTLSVDDGNTTGSWAMNLTFTSTAINQLEAFVTIIVDKEADADTYDPIGASGYTKSLDSWVFTPFAGIGPLPQFSETASTYFVHAGTPAGQDVGAQNFAYIVASGPLSWTGTISRGGVDYETAGEIPEPATLVVLGLGGLAALLRRRRA